MVNNAYLYLTTTFVSSVSFFPFDILLLLIPFLWLWLNFTIDISYQMDSEKLTTKINVE